MRTPAIQLVKPKPTATIAAATAFAIGGLVLVGWTFDVEVLKSVLPGWSTMKANAALSMVFCGAAELLLTRQSRSRISRLSVTVLALLAIAFGRLPFEQRKNLFSSARCLSARQRLGPGAGRYDPEFRPTRQNPHTLIDAKKNEEAGLGFLAEIFAAASALKS